MFKKLAVFLLIAASTLVVITGCAGSADKTDTGTVGTSSEEIGTGQKAYTVKVYFNDTLKVSLNLNDLLSLEQVVLTTPEQDTDQKGPTLISVLELAGIGEFSEVKVSGMTQGRVATAELTLTRAQVDDTVVLDITNRGTTKLAGLNIPSSDWIRDVVELRVK